MITFYLEKYQNMQPFIFGFEKKVWIGVFLNSIHLRNLPHNLILTTIFDMAILAAVGVLVAGVEEAAAVKGVIFFSALILLATTASSVLTAAISTLPLTVAACWSVICFSCMVVTTLDDDDGFDELEVAAAAAAALVDGAALMSLTRVWDKKAAEI